MVKSGVDFNEAIKFEEKEKAVEEESSPKDETIDVKEERKKRSRTMSGEHAVDAKAKAGESNTAFTKEAISKGKELVKNEEVSERAKITLNQTKLNQTNSLGAARGR